MKHHNFKKLVCFSVICIYAIKVNAQISNADFSSINNQPLQEKMFVHTDKDFYIAGEILWFKLYNVSTDSLKPLDVSKIAYVEVLNAQQRPVMQATVALNKGSGSGSFYLNSSLTSGNYIFRAYTNWMKNFGADAFFQKSITIVNTLIPINKKNDNDSDNYEIGFYPEGGNLVAGMQSKIAFKATDNYGNGINCNGNIVDESNHVIATFSTLKFGMGSFYFKSEVNHTYSAVTTINNKTITKALPAVNNTGYVMHLSNNTTNQFNISVQSNTDVQKPVYLVAYKNKIISSALTQTTDNSGFTSFSLQKNNLPAGITHIVVFNSEKQPVCEREIFIKPQSMQVQVTADKPSYETRSEVKINIAASNNVDASMAVYLIDSLQTLSDNTILNYLWFASDLKGKIQSPQYYFENNNSEADSALENLLLTQGWSRFKTQSEPILKFSPEYEGHIIEGKVTDKTSGLPAKNVRVYASVPGKHFRFASSISNDSGNVFFDVKDAYGSGELVVQTAKEDSTYRVEITNPFSGEPGSWNATPLQFSANNLQQLTQHNLAMQVQNAYSINKLNTFTNPLIDSNAFYGTPDNVYFLDNYVRFNTMEEVLREYVYQVNVRLRQGNYYLAVVDPRNHYAFEINPLVLVDGVPIFDMNKVIAYNPLRIQKAEIVTKKYYLNSLTADGIVSYSTYKGDLDGFPFEPGTIELSYDGLQLQREFYSPQYVTTEQKQSRLPDYRNTLYWSPQVKGNAQLSFYTSDVKGKYIVVTQGLDENGKAGYGTTEFEVK